MIFERGFLLSLFLIYISQGFAAGVCRFNLFLIYNIRFHSRILTTEWMVPDLILYFTLPPTHFH